MPDPIPHPVAPVRQALARLLRAARGFAFLCRRPTHALAEPATPAEPKPRPGFTLARTTTWLMALARTLAGDRFFHHPVAYPRFATRYPPLTAKLREEIGLPAVPPPTNAHRAADRLHYMRRVFATQATGVIAARLARRLGLTPSDAAWPHALIAIATPPARFAAARLAARRPRHSRPIGFARTYPWSVQTAPPQRRVPQRE